MFDFPTNPTNGQVYQNYYFDSSIGTWRNLGSKNALSSAVTALQTFDTNTVGMKNIVPSSIDLYGGGTATVGAAGEVVFTSATGLGLKNIFSSGYRNYRIVVSGLKSATGAPQLHMRFLDLSGAIDSTSNFYFGGWIVFGTGSGYINDIGANRMVAHYGFAGDNYNSFELEVSNPYAAVKTQYRNQYSGWYSASQNQNGFLGGFFDNTTQFSGVAFYSSTGTQITGEVTVYGYNK